jgi:hypothetical protein
MAMMNDDGQETKWFEALIELRVSSKTPILKTQHTLSCLAFLGISFD